MGEYQQGGGGRLYKLKKLKEQPGAQEVQLIFTYTIKCFSLIFYVKTNKNFAAVPLIKDCFLTTMLIYNLS
jgi:hypothetical protein